MDTRKFWESLYAHYELVMEPYQLDPERFCPRCGRRTIWSWYDPTAYTDDRYLGVVGEFPEWRCMNCDLRVIRSETDWVEAVAKHAPVFAIRNAAARVVRLRHRTFWSPRKRMVAVQ